MSRLRAARQRPFRSAASNPQKLFLATFLLALLAITGCSGTPTPVAETAAPPVASTMVTAPVIAASPTTTPRPAATFVPLTTPSPTPEGGALTASIVPRIEVGVAKQMADAGEAILVDVRSRATFEQAHIAGAISMPSSKVLDRYHELPTNKLVIFY